MQCKSTESHDAKQQTYSGNLEIWKKSTLEIKGKDSTLESKEP